jgi:hypothetical protein
MRITRETLLKIARDTAAQRVRASHRIVCVYLTGSLLNEEPLIGGTADIDLIIVHDGEPAYRREIVPLVDEIHLDIGHYSQSDFDHPRQLRQDPWRGSFIVSHPILLHDSAHWFDFTQATITSQFNSPENILARARSLEESARQAWMQLRLTHAAANPADTWGYLRAVEDAGNAFATLAGNPLPERRFWLDLAERATGLNHPELASDLLELLLPEPVDAETWQIWQPNWHAALAGAAESPVCPPRLHPARRAYYERAAAAQFEDQPAPAAWLALRTWTQAAALLPETPARAAWQAVIESLGLAGPAFSERLDAFDHYLDHLEETLDEWGRASGIS